MNSTAGLRTERHAYRLDFFDLVLMKLLILIFFFSFPLSEDRRAAATHPLDSMEFS